MAPLPPAALAADGAATAARGAPAASPGTPSARIRTRYGSPSTSTVNSRAAGGGVAGGSAAAAAPGAAPRPPALGGLAARNRPAPPAQGRGRPGGPLRNQ